MGETTRGLVFEAGARENSNAPGWGWFGLVASAGGLRMLTLPEPTREAAVARLRSDYADVPLLGDDRFLCDVVGQLREYLAAQREQFTVDLDLRGHMSFEQAVWATASRIPYGETRTYGWISSQIGTGPGSAQAVGAALGNNPVPVIVPCHRVIGSDGSLHGFAGGLDMKARLLALETRQLSLLWD